MKYFYAFAIMILLCFSVSLFSQSGPSQDRIEFFFKQHGFSEPRDVFTEAEEVIFPPVYYAVMEMNTVKPGKPDRRMTLESWYSKGEGTLMEFISPARQKGIRILQKEEALWLYNPRSNSTRPVRLSPRDSFQGSAFSNNDIGDPQYSDDYDVRITGFEELSHEELGSIAVVTAEGTASHGSAPYGKIIMKLSEEELLPVEIEYYAQSGLLFKHMKFSDFTNLAGRKRPRTMRMESLELEGFYSTVKIETLEARDDIAEWRFSESALTRR